MLKVLQKILDPDQGANEFNLFFLVHRQISGKILFYYVKTDRQTEREKNKGTPCKK